MLVSSLYVRFRDVQPIWFVVSTILFYGVPGALRDRHRAGQTRSATCSSTRSRCCSSRRADWIIDPSAPGCVDAIGGWQWAMVPLGIFVAVCALGVWVFNREAPRDRRAAVARYSKPGPDFVIAPHTRSSSSSQERPATSARPAPASRARSCGSSTSRADLLGHQRGQRVGEQRVLLVAQEPGGVRVAVGHRRHPARHELQRLVGGVAGEHEAQADVARAVEGGHLVEVLEHPAVAQDVGDAVLARVPVLARRTRSRPGRRSAP